MTVLENVELCDNGYVETREVNTSQKIKLRSSSHAVISERYSVYTNKASETAEINTEPTQVSAAQPVQTAAQITRVVAINPKVAEMLFLLDVKGKIGTEGYKALKVKPIMYDNIKKNSTSENDIAVATAAASVEQIVELEEPKQVESTPVEVIEEPVQAVEIPEDIKVSKNGATIARVEKYANEEPKVISPTVVEEQIARPVSREVPLVTPERPVVETKKELLIEPVTETKQQDTSNIISVNIIDNISNLAQLREYLAKTAQLQQEAAQAKTKETEAKANAERAEQEAANRRNELVRTAERIAAHQEDLIAQTERSNAQAHMYDEKRGEYEAERDEYEKAINDMLTLMGDDNQKQSHSSKEKVM